MAEIHEAGIRTAAIERVRELKELFAGRIPRAALLEGVTVGGERIPIWNQYKGIFKPRAFGLSGAALSVYTSIESPYEDVHDSTAGVIVYKYRGTDPDQADNVALRNAMLSQAPLIYFVAVDPKVYDAYAPVFVVGDDRTALQFTLMADQLAYSERPDAENTFIRREYATRAALQRLHQQQFRRVVLAAYREQCCICRLKHLDLLDAAHILPDRHPKGEPIISNGLGLCKIHHSAYDANILGVDPEARVHVREDILAETDGPMLQYGLQAMEGTRLTLPVRVELRPNPEFLAERFDRFRAA